MDVIPEIEARLKALENRIDALENALEGDGSSHLTAQAQAAGNLASATENIPAPESQPGIVPDNSLQSH